MDRKQQSRPGTPPSGSESNISSPIVTTDDDISVRDVLVAEIYALGPSALYAASLGWRLGRLDAEEIAKQKIGQAAVDVASGPEWRAVRRQPRWPQLQRRRGECVAGHRLESCVCAGGAT